MKNLEFAYYYLIPIHSILHEFEDDLIRMNRIKLINNSMILICLN